MFRGATVKGFKDALDDMKKVYNYDDAKTVISIRENVYEFVPNGLGVRTKDEETDVYIEMIKEVKVQDFE